MSYVSVFCVCTAGGQGSPVTAGFVPQTLSEHTHIPLPCLQRPGASLTWDNQRDRKDPWFFPLGFYLARFLVPGGLQLQLIQNRSSRLSPLLWRLILKSRSRAQKRAFFPPSITEVYAGYYFSLHNSLCCAFRPSQVQLRSSRQSTTNLVGTACRLYRVAAQ